MNPVLILTHNNLPLTKRCVESVWKQDISCFPFIVDNDSTDGTEEWALWFLAMGDSSGLLLLPNNQGVSFGWNEGLTRLFRTHEQVLVIGNDTVLAPWTYRALLSYELPFVTGVAVDEMSQIQQVMPPKLPLQDHPDFSCFLIRREVWEKVGRFNERMKHYCSDCDYHIRAHRMGIPLKKACVPFYHERSSTLRLAPPEERAEIEAQANKDRQVFKSMYGCLPGSPEYYALFK